MNIHELLATREKGKSGTDREHNEPFFQARTVLRTAARAASTIDAHGTLPVPRTARETV